MDPQHMLALEQGRRHLERHMASPATPRRVALRSVGEPWGGRRGRWWRLPAGMRSARFARQGVVR